MGMFETGTLLILAVGALLLGALYSMLWWATDNKAMWLKVLVRAGVPLIILALIAAFVPTFHVAKEAALPDIERQYEDRAERDGEARNAGGSKKKTVRRRRKTTGAGHDAIGGTALPPSVNKPASPKKSAEAATEPTAPPEAVERDDAGSELAEEAEGEEALTRSLQPGAGSNDDWDLVPVFYGTDRERADNAEKLDYAGDRGRRLELGRALVTVPKSHQVPNIERPWAIRIPYFDVTIYEEDEDPKKHFTMKEMKALTRESFLALVRSRLAKSERFKDQAFVFVHGFNTTFSHGVFRTAQIAYDLKFDGAPFLYSWPSGGGFSSYTYDRESAGQSEPYMKDFMKLVIDETGAKAVSVIAHSMGNQPVLQVLRDLKRSMPEGTVISQIILAAPDVDRDNFDNIAREIIGLAKGVTLYVSSTDQALEASRRFHGGVPRAGDVPESGPLVIDGIDTIDITAASTDSLGINHSGYAENNALLNDIAKVIETGAPPEQRKPPIFERIPAGDKAYWRYPKPAQ
jgi:esterase/lipase superfamily enzyme